MTTTIAWIVIAAVIAIAVVAWIFFRQQRSRRLRSRFGPEYDRAVRQYGGTEQAEQALAARQKRMEKVHIHPLTAPERERFSQLWHDVQSQFVDDPSGSIREADRIVRDVMAARGYPMTDFERRAENISVDYPDVVRNYREAHAIAERDARSEASTEDLRRALVCYRDLFDEMLEAHTAPRR